MRIVHLCRTAPPHLGGMETLIEGLARAQANTGHDVRIVTLDRGGSMAERDQLPTRALRQVGSDRYPFAWGLGAALKGAEIVHVHGIDGLADQVLTFRPKGARIGLSTHGGYLHTQRNARLKQLWLRTVTRFSLARADAVWFTSHADVEALKPARLSGKVVTNGVEVGPFRAVQSLRKPEQGRFVCVGRVDRHKGVDRLLRMLAPLAGKAEFTLEIIGPVATIELQNQLETLGRSYGLRDHLKWLGPVTTAEMAAAYARCEAAFFPSRKEGFAIGLVEAMAAGVAPFVQPIPAHVEKVTDGVEGFHLDFAQANEALASFQELRMRNREVMRYAAMEKAEQWSWERMVDAWQRAYAELIVSS